MKCLQCGAPVTPECSFCPYCGKAVATPQVPVPAPQPQQHQQQWNGQQQWPPQDPSVPPGYEQKSRLVAGILQLFAGTFGVGRFYLGDVTTGLLQLFFGWLTCGIWPLVDGIMILCGSVKTDAKGVPLKD